jgi:HD-like signal output (HDOD) protein
VADLQDITDIIRSDIGLTTQLLRLAAREMEEAPGPVVAISDIVVHVGLEKIDALVAQTRALPDDISGAAGLSAGERFWMHSKLTALLAEQIAGQSSEIRPGDAHMAGLLCHLGDLPLLMGWAAPGSDAADLRQIGYRMANAWAFPPVLAEVIAGDCGACHTRESRALLDIVTAADTWASRLKSLAEREFERRVPAIHLVD